MILIAPQNVEFPEVIKWTIKVTDEKGVETSTYFGCI